MGKCDTCGNEYDKSFDIRMSGETYTFDSFECAIQLLAPECRHCACKIIGHGIEADGIFYCCAHCAKESGVTGVNDHPASSGTVRIAT